MISKEKAIRKNEKTGVSTVDYENGEAHYSLAETSHSNRNNHYLVLNKLKKLTRKQAAEPLFIRRRE